MYTVAQGGEEERKKLTSDVEVAGCVFCWAGRELIESQGGTEIMVAGRFRLGGSRLSRHPTPHATNASLQLMQPQFARPLSSNAKTRPAVLTQSTRLIREFLCPAASSMKASLDLVTSYHLHLHLVSSSGQFVSRNVASPRTRGFGPQ
jgi:hypothetical protein